MIAGPATALGTQRKLFMILKPNSVREEEEEEAGERDEGRGERGGGGRGRVRGAAERGAARVKAQWLRLAASGWGVRDLD